jgi:DUF438 domain-containing protein
LTMAAKDKQVEMVEKLIAEMKAGQRDMARFWIDAAVPDDSRKHKILFEFHALRDPSGKYLGCMEWAQDVEHIVGLKGEKRLLD